MGGNNGFDNGKANACPTGLPVSGFIGPVKSFKD